MFENLKSKVQGALIGFVLGDALGMPVRQFSYQDANRLFKEGIKPRDGNVLKAGQFTSHSLMLLATLSSLLEKATFDPADIAERLAGAYEEALTRGMGASTQSALRRLKRGILWFQAGDFGPLAVGRGPLMRVLPVALWTLSHPESMAEAATAITMITHRSEEAVASAIAYSRAIQETIRGQIEGLFRRCSHEVKGTKTSLKLRQAEELYKKRVTPNEAIRDLGNSGLATETVSSALYSFVYFPRSYREAITGPLLAGGDSSATAALAGALSGSFLGLDKIPQEWVEALERKEEILTLSENFARLVAKRVGDANQSN